MQASYRVNSEPAADHGVGERRQQFPGRVAWQNLQQRLGLLYELLGLPLCVLHGAALDEPQPQFLNPALREEPSHVRSFTGVGGGEVPDQRQRDLAGVEIAVQALADDRFVAGDVQQVVQIQDDLLDITGDEAVVGSPVTIAASSGASTMVR